MAGINTPNTPNTSSSEDRLPDSTTPGKKPKKLTKRDMVADVDVDGLKQAYLREASGETGPYRKYRLSGRKTTGALINVIGTPEEINDYANKELITLSEEEKLTLLIDAAAEQLGSMYKKREKEQNASNTGPNADKKSSQSIKDSSLNVYNLPEGKKIIDSLFGGNKLSENNKRYKVLQERLKDQYGLMNLMTQRVSFGLYDDDRKAGGKEFLLYRDKKQNRQEKAA